MQGVIGEIRAFGGNFAPRTWALCNGQLLAISSNTALFSIIGTTYGGDGRTTFKLPDLRGRVAISEGTGPGLTPRKLGATGGVEDVTLTTQQMASHFHWASTSITSATASVHTGSTASGQLSLSNDQNGATDGDNAYMSNNSGEEIYGSPKTNNYSADGSVEIDDWSGARLFLSSAGITGGTTLAPEGGGQDHNNLAPYTTVHYIICMQGIYPSRS